MRCHAPGARCRRGRANQAAGEPELSTTTATLEEGARLDLALDADDPTPLYHQIAQAIRWRIGVGDLRPGDRLPTLRTAAEEWGVNLHTVRRAYGALADAGLLDSRPGAGTTVAGVAEAGARATSSAAASELDRWIETIIEEARQGFGLTPGALSARIHERGREPVIATLVECNRHQSGDLAGQVAAALGGRIEGWSLEASDEPPPGTLIGTRFHAAEMRRRWPHRHEDMRFVSLRVDPGLGSRVRGWIRDLGATRLTLCDVDAATARQMAVDVGAVVGRMPPIEPVGESPARVLERLGADEILLVAPRRWGSLSAAARRDPRVIEVRHVIDPDELRTLDIP